MKKIVITGVALLAVTCACTQQTEKTSTAKAGKNTPEVVKAAFAKEYPEADDLEWEQEGANYEAEFEQNDEEMSVLIDASGKILETEVEIAVESLPAAVKTYVNEHYKAQKIKEAAKIVSAVGITTYEAEIKDGDLLFDANGQFIKAEKE